MCGGRAPQLPKAGLLTAGPARRDRLPNIRCGVGVTAGSAAGANRVRDRAPRCVALNAAPLPPARLLLGKALGPRILRVPPLVLIPACGPHRAGLSAFVATQPAFQAALATGGNLADLTSKNQAQHMVGGLSSGGEGPQKGCRKVVSVINVANYD